MNRPLLNRRSSWVQALCAAVCGLAFAAAPARAADAEKLDFSLIQSECVQSAGLRFGPTEPWRDCKLVHSGFVATIGLQDFYYAEYCLAAAQDDCASKALLLFRNRGYRPEAFLDMLRLDPPGTRYDSPLLIGEANDNVLATGLRAPGQEDYQRRYYRYENERWVPIDGQAWLAQLKKRLPNGLQTRIQALDAMPDPRTLMLTVPLYRAKDRDCCASGGSATVRLAVQDNQMQLAEVQISRKK